MNEYFVAKSLHLIGVVSWFAGLFYIFRLYVYHVENQDKKEVTDVLQIMERRLYHAIIWPAFLLTLVAGVWLFVMQPELIRAKWFQIKILFLFLLMGYHFFAGYTRKRFVRGDFFLTSRHCRLINEVPTLVLVVIIPLAVSKCI